MQFIFQKYNLVKDKHSAFKRHRHPVFISVSTHKESGEEKFPCMCVNTSHGKRMRNYFYLSEFGEIHL